ncbi:MAG: hypothetical protein UT05_C0002G0028 [Parcubacteria group bacterium GW2011_GWF2_38_76]|nr:MAG: hypothetical protein UT05_C0002G0028 [Parcubacteria group bacterium GW2011_GWF2_38_76]HBM45814.1 hypothetical protein [Patescibacteria group bacterium]
MKKNKIIICGLIVASLLVAPIAFAQEYVIPEPVCIDTLEIPCPDRGNSYEKAQKPTSDIKYDVPTGFSKIFDYLSGITTKINNTLDYTIEGLKNWFRNVYDGILYRFGKV